MKAVDRLLGKKVVIRSYGAGVFYGTLNEYEKCEEQFAVELLKVRRLWSWEGACSATQIAIDGPKKPDKCNFTMTEESIIVAGVIEIHEATEQAQKVIESVKDWKC